MEQDLYFIKLGGSIITDTSSPSTHRWDVIVRLLGEIKKAKDAKKFGVLIGHGGGSFGHVVAKEYKVHEGLINSQSGRGAEKTHDAMHQLNNIVVNAADELELSPYPFAPSSFAHSSDRTIVGGDLEGIRIAIEKGFTPIVHGDVMHDSKQGISVASTEEVFRFISTGITPNKIILGTDTDGVFDADPASNPNAKLIPLIDSSNIESVIAATGGAKKVDVTGGMKTKISLLHEMVKRTKATGYIVNASKPGVIENLLLGNEVTCTIVRA
ncbi:MAG: isopentenyl phosphate kinase family protein [Candidatus Micrarchaeota archaeon]|nr:isopentenyl phosphate kinase family protein [Candidatus Micrarchaeota archaeon]